jgi:hypothetical protein
MSKGRILNAEEGMKALRVFTDYQNMQREVQVSKTVAMVTPDSIPWAESITEQLSFMNMEQVNKVLALHPGKNLHKIWQSIESLLNIFKLSYDDTQLLLDEFHQKAQEANFFSRRRQKEFESVCLNINKCMYHLSCTSIALYNISQEFRGLFAPDGYIDHYEASYTNSAEHHLLKAIRNALSHKHFAPANYRVTKVGDVYQTEFCVSCYELLEYGDLRETDKKYVLKAGERIKVRPVIEQHYKNVVQFYGWVQEQLNQDIRFTDYLKCKLVPKQNGARIWWVLMMQQIEAKGLDPYQYLPNYFTDEELEEIDSLPHRSKQQVDRMIEIYDVDKACNEEFRKKLYDFLGVG